MSRFLLPRAAVIGGAVAAVVFTGLLIAIATSWEPLRQLDLSGAEWGATLGSTYSWWVPLWTTVSAVFGPWTYRVLAILAIVWALTRRHRTQRAERGCTSEAVIVGALIVLAGGLLPALVKEIVERPRPAAALVDALQSSFPSAHAFAVWTAVGVALLLHASLPSSRLSRAILTVGAIAIASIVCLARVALAVHYVSDVIAGAALGVLWVTCAWFVWRWRGEPVVTASSAERE